MAEITLKCIDEIDARYLYGYFKRSLELIDTGFDSFTLLNIYLARTLSEAGFGLCVDSCSNCKTRESIVGISFIEGGFVCKNCHTNDMVDFEKLDERNLKIYRYLFKVKPDQIDHVEFEKEENRRFFKNLHSYLLDQTGAKITTYELAKNL